MALLIEALGYGVRFLYLEFMIPFDLAVSARHLQHGLWGELGNGV